MSRSIIAALLIAAGTAYGQSTSTWQTVTMQDGTNALSTNGVQLVNAAVSGTMTAKDIRLSTVVWDDLRFPATGAAKLNPSSDIVLNSTANGIDYKTSCDTNITDEHTYYVAQFSHRRKPGTDIVPHVHFTQTNVDQTNMWYLWYRWYDIGGTVGVWTVSGPATNAATYTAGSMHQLADFATITGSTLTNVSSILDAKIMRDGNFGTGTVLLKEFDIHYQIDRLGSAQEGAY